MVNTMYNRILHKMKKEYSKGYRYQMSIRKKLEEVFFKAPKWQFKTKPDNLPPKSTRAGDVPRTDEIFSNEELFSKSSGISNRTIYDAIQSEMAKPDMHIHSPPQQPFALDWQR